MLPNIAAVAHELLPAVDLHVGPQHDGELVALGARMDTLLSILPGLFVEKHRLWTLCQDILPPIPAGLLVDPANLFSRDVEYFTAPLSETFIATITGEAAAQARDIAEIAYDTIEPFRCGEADLDRRLQGAFVRWQVEQVKRMLDGKWYRTQALPLMLEATIQAFGDRLLELQGALEPGGGSAA